MPADYAADLIVARKALDAVEKAVNRLDYKTAEQQAAAVAEFTGRIKEWCAAQQQAKGGPCQSK